jgi:hypothetical protein
MGKGDRDSKRPDGNGESRAIKEHVKTMLRKLSTRPKDKPERNGTQ